MTSNQSRNSNKRKKRDLYTILVGSREPYIGSLVRSAQQTIKHRELVLMLCKHRAFDEGKATEVLSNTSEGVEFLFQSRAIERLSISCSIARVLVFQETSLKRLERAKLFAELKHGSEIKEPNTLRQNFIKLNDLLLKNSIEPATFFRITFLHYAQRTAKKNNMFFSGPPSTGKTMIAESLADCHFNVAKITGLNTQSTFNFVATVHANACLMDECKLTSSQLEQWKCLAAGTTMSTDVNSSQSSYTVNNCILYTTSNFPLEMYCKEPSATQAIEERTITYKLHHRNPAFITLTPWDWEYAWNQHGQSLT